MSRRTVIVLCVLLICAMVLLWGLQTPLKGPTRNAPLLNVSETHQIKITAPDNRSLTLRSSNVAADHWITSFDMPSADGSEAASWTWVVSAERARAALSLLSSLRRDRNAPPGDLSSSISVDLFRSSGDEAPSFEGVRISASTLAGIGRVWLRNDPKVIATVDERFVRAFSLTDPVAWLDTKLLASNAKSVARVMVSNENASLQRIGSSWTSGRHHADPDAVDGYLRSLADLQWARLTEFDSTDPILASLVLESDERSLNQDGTSDLDTIVQRVDVLHWFDDGAAAMRLSAVNRDDDGTEQPLWGPIVVVGAAPKDVLFPQRTMLLGRTTFVPGTDLGVMTYSWPVVSPPASITWRWDVNRWSTAADADVELAQDLAALMTVDVCDAIDEASDGVVVGGRTIHIIDRAGNDLGRVLVAINGAGVTLTRDGVARTYTSERGARVARGLESRSASGR